MDMMTKPCRVCGNNAWVFGVDALGYLRWVEFGEDIQDALPELTSDERELLMTGTHAHCWEKMWEGADA